MNPKTQIEQELESLREKAVARNLREKYTGSGNFLSPEEAEVYLAKQRKLQDQTLTVPTNITSSVEISNWYTIQRQRDLDERKKREEAEGYLRAYRPQQNVRNRSTLSTDPSCPTQECKSSEASDGDDAISEKSSSSKENIKKDGGKTPVVIFSSMSDRTNTLKPTVSYTISSSYEKFEMALPGTDMLEEATESSPRSGSEENRRSTKTPQNYHSASPTLPFSLSDLSDWYMIQRQRELDERKKREEAEAYLRSYRPQWFQSNDRKQAKQEKTGVTALENKQMNSDQMKNVEIEMGKLEGARGSPVLRMISHFLQDQFNDEDNRLFFPTLNDSCYSPTSTAPETELSSDMKQRFELYMSHGCHYSHQIAVTICVKGLTNIFSIIYYSSPKAEGVMEVSLDSSPGCKLISVSIPCLIDKKEKTVVSMDPSIILQKINSDFNAHARFPHLDLYPIDSRTDIDDITKNLIYKGLYEGALNCGVAKSQQEYDHALDLWMEAFNQVHALLQLRRYVAGSDTITFADIALFTVLIRFDDIFASLFHVNNKIISSHPTLMNYLREIFQIPDVEETVDMEAMKVYYYRKYPKLTSNCIIPRGNDYFVLRLKQPHNRISSLQYFMQAFEAKPVKNYL